MIAARFAPAACLIAGLALGACAATGPFRAPGPPAEPPPGGFLAEGLRLLEVGSLQGAERAFIRSLRTEDRPAAALTGAGLAAARRGLLRKAHRFFRQAHDLAPGSPVANNNLGVVLYRLGRYAEARRAFRTAFAVSSGKSDMALYNMELAEAALAREAPRPDPAVTHGLQRLGSSEYRLFEKLPSDRQG